MTRSIGVRSRKDFVTISVFILLIAGSSIAFPQTSPGRSEATAAQDSNSAAAVGKWVGSVEIIEKNEVTLTLDTGNRIVIVVPESARIVRTTPGQNDLKTATAISLLELQIGDRMLVRGKLSDDGKSVVATSGLVMKQSEVTQKQENDRKDWEKRGIGGLITAVDEAAGKITISSASATGISAITVNVSKATILRRYAPDSVKFNDARPGTMDQIKAGDQLRARGSKSADAKEFSALEIVSGSFRNIAGTITSVDSTQSTISLIDLTSKKPLTIKVTSDSALRKLPPQLAQMIAMRLKGGMPGPPNSGSGPRPTPSPDSSQRDSGPMTGGGAERPRGEGAPDFQQILSRTPKASLADLKNGDAVIIVATQGEAAVPPTAITLLSGVEPILSASPTPGGAASVLSPWNLSASAGDSAAQ